MKKHIIIIISIILILSLAGVGVWFVVKKNNSKPLYSVSCEFIQSSDTQTLISKIGDAEDLYQNKAVSTEDRLTTLQQTISKLDNFETDLTSYLLLSNAKASSTNKLSKSYKDLASVRSALIKDYNEYITRMSGNTNISGTALKDLYNELFNKTVNYVYKYNTCFIATSNYVFTKVYKVDCIKTELYTLYSAGVSNLLNNISNSQFANTSLITKLNNGIKLVDGNIFIKENIQGGEFGTEALNFKKYFNNSNLDTLINNFETYYNMSINASSETNSEKLTVYYAKLILEI